MTAAAALVLDKNGQALPANVSRPMLAACSNNCSKLPRRQACICSATGRSIWDALLFSATARLCGRRTNGALHFSGAHHRVAEGRVVMISVRAGLTGWRCSTSHVRRVASCVCAHARWEVQQGGNFSRMRQALNAWLIIHKKKSRPGGRIFAHSARSRNYCFFLRPERQPEQPGQQRQRPGSQVSVAGGSSVSGRSSRSRSSGRGSSFRSRGRSRSGFFFLPQADRATASRAATRSDCFIISTF